VAHEAAQLGFISWVTVQEFTTARSAAGDRRPSDGSLIAKASRTRSVSYWFALQPKV